MISKYIKQLLILVLISSFHTHSVLAQCPIDFTIEAPQGNCQRAPIKFIPTDLNGALYIWDFGDQDSSFQIQPIHQFTQGAGTYTVTLTYISESGVTCSSSKPITLTSAPSITASSPDFGLHPEYLLKCTPPNETDKSFPTSFTISGGASSSYSWDWGDGSPKEQGPELTRPHTYENIGRYFLSITAEGETCPGFVQQVAVLTQPLVNLVIESDATICEGSPITVSNGTDPTIGPVEFYTWDRGIEGIDPDTVYDERDQTFIYTLSPEALQEVSFSGIEGEIGLRAHNTCFTHSEKVQITIQVKPRPNFSAPSTICAQDSVVDFINTSFPSPPYISPSTFEWDFGDPASGAANTSTEMNPSHTYTQPGTYIVTLKATNNCGDSTTTRTINVLEAVEAGANVLPDTIGCVPFELEVENLTTPNSTGINPINFTWDVEGSGSYAFLDSNVLRPVIVLGDSGTYNITLEARSNCNTDNWEQTIVVSRPPIVSLATIPDTCDTYDYFPEVEFNDFGSPITSYHWEFNNGSISTSSDSLPPGPITFPEGSHMVRVVAENICGPGAAQESFIVAGLTPADAGSDLALCVNENAQILQGNSSLGIWEGPGVSQDSVFVPSEAGTGVHTVYYRIGIGACQTLDSIRITVQAAPTVGIATDDISACEGAPAIPLVATPTIGTWSGSTLLPGDLVSTDSIGSFSFYYATTDSLNGCSSRDTVSVTIHPLPEVSVQDTLYCLNADPITLEGATPQSGGTGSWSGNGIINPVLGIFQSSVPGTYPLTYTFTTDEGCQDTASMQLSLIEAVDAFAGADTTICRSEEVLTLNGGPVQGTWLGNVSFLNTNQVDLLSAPAGTTSLIYSIGAGSCLSQDTLLLEILESDIVEAGTDTTLCDGAQIYSLSNFQPLGGIWSGKGIIDAQGVFAPDSLLPGESVTLSYTVTNANQCTSQGGRSILLDSLPSSIFVIPDTACTNSLLTIQNQSVYAADYSWQWGNGENSTGLAPSFAYTQIGDYQVTLAVASSNGCRDTSSQLISILDAPTASFLVVDKEGCAPFTTRFEDLSDPQSADYAWDFGNGQLSNERDPDPITFLQGLQDTLYFVELTLTNQCGTTSSRDSILVFPQPIADFGVDFLNQCSPAQTNFNNLSLGQPTSFLWNFRNGQNSTDSIPPTQIFIADSIDSLYQITLTAFNTCGVDSLSDTIRILPKNIQAFFTTEITQGCAPLPVDFLDRSGATHIKWDFGDGSGPSTLPAPTHVFEEAGVYEVFFFVDNVCSFDTQSVEITVFPNQPTEIVSNSPICVNEPLQLSMSDSSKIGSVIWRFGNGDSSLDFSPAYLYSNPGSYTVSLLTRADSFQCTFETAMPIIVNDIPNAAFALDTTRGCAPFRPSLVEVPQAVLYLWNFGDGNSSTSSSPTPTYSDAGTYSLSLEVADSNLCRNQDSILLTVHPVPQSDFTLSADTLCINQVLSLSNGSTGADAFTWNDGRGTLIEAFAPDLTYDSAETYTVSLLSINNLGCTDSMSQTVVILPQTQAQFVMDTSIGCVPLAVTFTNESLFASNALWRFGDNSFPSTEISPSHLFELADTVLEISLRVDTAGFCADTANRSIRLGSKPESRFIPSIDESCGEVSIAFDNLSLSRALPLSFTWDFEISQSSLENPVIDFPAEEGLRVYRVTLVATNSYGCQDTFRDEIRIYPQPVADFEVTATDSCGPAWIQFTNRSTDFNQILWDFGDGNQSEALSPSHIYFQGGLYFPRLSLNFDNKCFDALTLPIPIKVVQSPIPDFSYINVDTVSTEARGTVQFLEESIFGDRFLWNFGDGDTSTLPNPIHTYTYNDTFEVTLQVFNDLGCDSLIRKKVAPWPFGDLFIPNAFAPNSVTDYTPDYAENFQASGRASAGIFHPIGIGLQSFEMSIYDKWGKRIWHVDSESDLGAIDEKGRIVRWWDGTIGSGSATLGVYAWKVQKAIFIGGREWNGPREGTVTLLK